MRCMHGAIRTALYALLTHAIFLSTADVETHAQALDKPEAAKHLVAMISGQLGPEAHDLTSGAGIIFGYKDSHLYIATANHVVRRGAHTAKDLRVQLRMLPGETLAAELMPQTVGGLDLAVLRVSGVKDPEVGMFPFRRVGDPAVLNRGDAVYHVGFPGRRPWRTNVTADGFFERVDDALFFESMSVSRGDSGGGLFNGRWELIGMVVRDEPPEGKALDIGHILEHLGQWGFPVSLRYTVFHATKIAYISTRIRDNFSMSADAYIMNPDGTGQTRLTNNLTEAYWNHAQDHGQPQHRLSWSPDGKSIAFVTDFSGRDNRFEGRYGQGDIYRIDANGTNLVNLTNHPARDSTPSWSPDGKKIAFMSDRSGRWEIYTINADGTKPLAITRNTPADANYNLAHEKDSIAFNFTWSPDSKKIAFVLEHGAESGIHVVNADGTNQMRLTENNLSNPSLSWSPALSWSPDGKRIAFAHYFKGIFVINADGTNLVELTKSGKIFKPIRYPSWSPDGTKILFTARGPNWDERAQIWVVTADGTRLTKLTSEWHADTAVWSPDGSMIACQEDGRKLCVMNADGTEPICWTLKVGRMFLPSWSPFFR